MNRIVRESYPVADLPEDLRQGFSTDENVRITVEPVDPPLEHVLSLDQLFAMRRPPYRTIDEIVEEVRSQRDESDD